MSNVKGSSQGLTSKGKACIKGVKVTDQFYEMITKALEATKRVLKIRAENLNAWTKDDEDKFQDIFGLPGKTPITIDYYTPLQKVNENEELTPFQKPTTAYQFIKDGVSRMIAICDSLVLGVRIDQDNQRIIYGNFSNLTALNLGSARVAPMQSVHVDIKNYKYLQGEYKNKSQEEILKIEYQDKITIDILQNFTCKALTGRDSQVSTLCHELSHLFIVCDGDQYYGGLGSADLGQGREINNAKDLKINNDKRVFENAYNIEKYFEIN